METESEKLTPAQLHLLRLFSQPMSDDELTALQQTLVDFYAQRIDNEVDKLWESGQITQEKLDERLSGSAPRQS